MRIFGTPGVGGNTYAGNYVLGFRFTSSQSGTVTAIHYYTPQGQPQWASVPVAIYRDSDQALLSTPQSHTPSGTGEQTCTLTTPVAISASESYTACIFFEDGSNRVFWEGSQTYPVTNSPLQATAGSYVGSQTIAYPSVTDSVWDGIDIEFTAGGGGAAALAAAASNAAAATAALSTAIRFAAAPAGVSAASAALAAGPAQFAAAAAAVTAAVANLSTQIRAAASSGAISASTAALLTAIRMGAAPQAVASAGPQNLSASIRFAAAPAAGATATADIRPAFDLSWDAPVGWTPAGYRVKWGTSSGSYPNTQDVGAGVLTFTLTGLEYNTTYYWIVVGLDGGGAEQTPSAEGTFNTLAGTHFAATPTTLAGASAALTAAIRMGAAPAVIADAEAALGAHAALAAAAAGLTGASAAITTVIQLHAVTAALAQVTAAFSISPAFRADASGRVASSAGLSTQILMGAAPAALSAAAAQLQTQIQMAVAAANTATASGTLAGTAAGLQAAAADVATVTAALTKPAAQFEAGAAGEMASNATLSTLVQFASAAQALATAMAQLAGWSLPVIGVRAFAPPKRKREVAAAWS